MLKSSFPGSTRRNLADQVEFVASHDNSPELSQSVISSICILCGQNRYNETVLIFRHGRRLGRLMFNPTRILSVKNYG